MKYMKIEDIKAQYDLSTSTIYRMRRMGNFPPAVRVSPGKIGFLPAEVEQWWNDRDRV